MKKKILVIGGTGFLGSHVCQEAIKRNYQVISVSSNKTKFIKIKKIKYIECDISSSTAIKNKLNFDVDYIINLGGYVDHSNKKKTYQTHFIGCKNLVDFYQKKKIKKFVQIGSSLEYGQIKSPHKETNLIKKAPVLKSTYAQSKLLSTKYCLNAFKKSFFPVTILRPYLVYGPGQNINRLIPFIILNCLKNKNFPCSSGEQIRNFLFIEDFVKAIFKTLASKNAIGEIINVGSNKNLKVKKVILMITNHLNSGNPMFGQIKLRKDESKKYYPNIRKANSILKWKPYVQFEKGINHTIKFYLKNK